MAHITTQYQEHQAQQDRPPLRRIPGPGSREQDLDAQLRALVEQTQVLAQRKRVALSYPGPGEPVRAWCDPERLERVFVAGQARPD